MDGRCGKEKNGVRVSVSVFLFFLATGCRSRYCIHEVDASVGWWYKQARGSVEGGRG